MFQQQYDHFIRCCVVHNNLNRHTLEIKKTIQKPISDYFCISQRQYYFLKFFIPRIQRPIKDPYKSSIELAFANVEQKEQKCVQYKKWLSIFSTDSETMVIRLSINPNKNSSELNI